MFAGGNVFVRGRFDIGVYPQRGRGAHTFRVGNFVDVFELRLALDIKAIDALLESVLDFLARLSDTGKGARGRIATRFDHAKKFAAGNDVESGTFIAQQPENRAIRVRLYRITDLVIQIAKRSVESAIMIANRSCTVDIDRRPDVRGDLGEIDLLAMQGTGVIAKRMHGLSLD